MEGTAKQKRKQNLKIWKILSPPMWQKTNNHHNNKKTQNKQTKTTKNACLREDTKGVPGQQL